jgi:hypothetical protein
MIFESPARISVRFNGIKMSINGDNQAGFINSRKQPQPASSPKTSKISATLDKSYSSGPLKISLCPLPFSSLE